MGLRAEQGVFLHRQLVVDRLLLVLQLRLAVLQLGLALLQLLSPVRQLPLALQQLGPAVLQLRLALLQFLSPVRQLLLRIFHLVVDGGEYLPVDGIHLVLADDDVHALLQQTRGADAGHALDALQLRHDLILDICTDSGIVHALHAHRRDHHRQHVGIQFHNDWIPDRVVPVALDLVQALPDLQGNRVHVSGLGKFQNHHGIVLIGHGADALDIAHRGHGSLHRLGHRHLHGLRAGPRVSRHHDDIGEADAGQQVRSHPGKGHHPQNNSQHHPYQYCIRLPHTEFRNHIDLLIMKHF